MFLSKVSIPEKIFIATLISTQIFIGALGKSYFPISSWNLYSSVFNQKDIKAYRIEARSEDHDYRPISLKYSIFHETVYNHKMRVYYRMGKVLKIKKALHKLLTHSRREGLSFNGLRYVELSISDTLPSGLHTKVIMEAF